MSKINLLPLQQNVCIAHIHQLKKMFFLGLLMILIILLALMGIYKINASKIKQHIFDTKTQMSEHTEALIAAKDLDKNIENILDNINHIKTAQIENINLLKFLNQLPQHMPDDLYVVSLSWHEHVGIIYGQAHQQKTVMEFLSALKNGQHFKNIDLIKSDKRHENDNSPPIYFVINFHE